MFFGTGVTALPVVLLLLGDIVGFSSGEFEDNFKNCHPDLPGFDTCVREGLNAIRPYFKTGLSEYGVEPFDPFFAREVKTSRGLPNLGFTVTLKNVTESGWSSSKVTKFVSDLPNYKVRYTQSFPEKHLAGDYEFTGAILGSRMNNRGKFTLTLYDLIQTTTITMAPNSKIQVRVDVQSIRDLALHISHLLYGREVLEAILDRIINGVWQPGFSVTRPIINDLVSNAFTDIFGKAFQKFPFEKIIQTSKKSTRNNAVPAS
ncbi:uncharacterized protein LOC107272306 [Cephus cinctus]|uniref:Uncharacterized protein LOC107272306 n=1 Tax=Cephus cinctus TaxID=211228 RepID=A0AAJ7FRL6_CEPCN|nr:uncharacterized protein LOC107272306 [Cephus cinctus]